MNHLSPLRAPGLYVGAYAASPSHSEWKPEEEAAYLGALAQIPEITGLELPFHGFLHKHDPEWLLAHLKPSWNYVITGIPGTMEILSRMPRFGLASDAEEGRGAAIAFAQQALLSVQRLNRHFGRETVAAVEIHSAPKLGAAEASSSVRALVESLREIAAWDWQGAELMVEHCDRYVETRPGAKRFLALEDECRAVAETGPARTPLSVLINWGRSALEEQDADAPVRHLNLARMSGCLGGLMFSGCTAGDPQSPYGDWMDSHAPFRGVDGSFPHSLLDLARTREALRAADWRQLRVLGLKMQALPKTLTTEERIHWVRQWVGFLQMALG